MKERIRVMSGVQPSGDLHIGNWLGAIRRWAESQDRWEGFFCVVDLHALTEPRSAAELREKTLEVAAVYLACGVDPARSHVFVQSHVPAHSELAWLLDCFLPMGWLERMTQFKVRSRGHRERASVGPSSGGRRSAPARGGDQGRRSKDEPQIRKAPDDPRG